MTTEAIKQWLVITYRNGSPEILSMLERWSKEHFVAPLNIIKQLERESDLKHKAQIFFIIGFAIAIMGIFSPLYFDSKYPGFGWLLLSVSGVALVLFCAGMYQDFLSKRALSDGTVGLIDGLKFVFLFSGSNIDAKTELIHALFGELRKTSIINILIEASNVHILQGRGDEWAKDKRKNFAKELKRQSILFQISPRPETYFDVIEKLVE